MQIHWQIIREIESALNGHTETMRLHVNRQDHHGRSALMWAQLAFNGSTMLLADATTITQMLLAVPDINVNLQDQNGNCALTLAAQKGHKETVQLLLAVPEIDDQNLSRALELAVKNNHTEVAKEIRWARRRHYATFLSGTYRNAGGGEEDERTMRRKKREEGKMNSALDRVFTVPELQRAIGKYM